MQQASLILRTCHIGRRVKTRLNGLCRVLLYFRICFPHCCVDVTPVNVVVLVGMVGSIVILLSIQPIFELFVHRIVFMHLEILAIDFCSPARELRVVQTISGLPSSFHCSLSICSSMANAANNL